MKKIKKEENLINSSFLSIPRLQIRKEIKSDLSWLDDNYICSVGSLSDDTILLFGHNHSFVFHFLYQLEIGDEIRIEQDETSKIYHVSEIKIISTKEEKYLEKKNVKELRMFTCTKNKNYRLVVIAN